MSDPETYPVRGLRAQGGTPVTPGDFLDCVVVGSGTQWACSGTLIAQNAVITASFCQAFAKRVFFGHDVRKPGKIVRVRKLLRHPTYAKQTQSDVVVLLLDHPVDSIMPRRLAPKSLIDEADDARFVGFGSSHEATLDFGVKRFIDMQVISPACAGKIGGRPESEWYGCERGREMVAGDRVRQRDSGRGDGGAPLYIQDAHAEWLVAGITLRSIDTAVRISGEGGIYARVDRYRAWIASIPGVKLSK